LAKIIDWKKEEGSGVSDDLHAQALEMRADLLVTRGKRNEAIKGYRELLTQYEASRPLESVRYRLGQLLFQDGDLKGAEEVWGELRVAKNEAAGGAAAAGAAGANAPKKESLWQKLATEQMQSAKWQNEYKKYLNRIPAAAELRESKAQR
jgi:predicted Zn-dependent protease